MRLMLVLPCCTVTVASFGESPEGGTLITSPARCGYHEEFIAERVECQPVHAFLKLEICGRLTLCAYTF